MTTTEEDARTKWCPYSFAAQPVVNEYGAEVQCAGPWMCRGSECMAWRWVLTEKRHAPLGVQERVEGYCGLSGSPVALRL